MVTVEHVEIKEMPFAEAKSTVELYLRKIFKKKRQVYPSDVADALGLSYETVREVFQELENEGKIQESR